MSESRRQSPHWHTLDVNLATWVVRGCPPVCRLPRRFHHDESLLVRTSRGSAALSGHPFLLKCVFYASRTSTSTGTAEWMPWGTHGLVQVTQTKVYPFHEDGRIKD